MYFMTVQRERKEFQTAGSKDKECQLTFSYLIHGTERRYKQTEATDRL